ncbi:MBL fold metallo-hydrolase [Paracoccus ravus]|uniref:MBL fold metallo-hydrolase n=1 Tax=Paracoccus ravus TaxID=2447760 RepID=UPI001ADBB78C|nr:MBL fold metallo-hydrolase [Paracoccus ravus]
MTKLTTLAAAGLMAVISVGAGHAQEAEPAIRVTLLGTASPAPRPDRSGSSTLVEAGGLRLVFDAGRGVPVRLSQKNIPVGAIDALFVTHFHSDHVSGIPDLWMTGYIPAPYGRRETPFRVIGPRGTGEMMQHIDAAFSIDKTTRIEDEKITPESVAMDVSEFTEEGVVFDQNGVTVTAFTVNHGELIEPSVGYRIAHDGHAVVISGDTKFDENLIESSKGADVLSHEVAMARPELATQPVQSRILGHHTLPAEAGEGFARVAPRLAVYTHIVMLSTQDIPEPSIDDLVAETRTTYDGPLEVGEDLMTISVGEKVTVERLAK